MKNPRGFRGSPLFYNGRILLFLLPALLIASCVSSSGAGPAEKVVPESLPGERPPPVQPGEEEAPRVSFQSILEEMAALLGRRDFDGALALFDTLDPADAESSPVRLLKASVLSSAGRFAGSRAIVEDLLSEEPQNTDALFVLAVLEGAEGKEREERTTLERILKLNPAHVDALSSLGTIALRSRSFRTAASYFDRVLAIEPDNGDALIGKAEVFRHDQDHKNAELLLNKAVSLYPQWEVPLSERARLYRQAGYPIQALADLDGAIKIDGRNYWLRYDRGIILMDLNRKQEALGEFTQAIALGPDNFIAYVYSAGIKDEMGDFEGAEQDYITLIRLKPEYYFAYEGLGTLKMRKGLWAEARDAFLEAYRQAPQESNYAMLAALNWMRAGKVNDPRQFLEQALRRVPRETLEWYVLRLYHDLAGDNDLAVRIDREKNPDIKSRMLYYLASYYDIRGNKTLADKYFLQIQELGRRGIIEWRLNEWTLEQRNLTLN
ncbi:MAG: tetratricopeptide repeat protein [Treponema sp.]|nr:tetratricopeptide repeat protein [Treponema sp.]